MAHSFMRATAIVCLFSGAVFAGDVSPASNPALPPVQSDRFAINTHLRRQGEGPALLPMVAQGGFAMFRDGEEWKSIEKKPGVYAVNPITDQMIQEGAKDGVAPIFLLGYGNANYANQLDPEKFADHAIWMMDRYKGKVQYWEIWGEPENYFFRKQYGGTWNGVEKNGSESPWVGKFADFVTIVAARLKAAHPEVKLLTGSSAVVDVRFLRDHPKMWENIDVLSIHPYAYRLPPEMQPYGGPKIHDRDGVDFAGPDHSFASQIQIYRDLLKNIGKPDMPIWVTEVGYSTFTPRKPSPLWAGFTEAAQAIYLVRFGILSASLGIDRTFFYCFMDSGNDDGDVEERFGLVRRDGSPKRSYAAIKRLAALMPGNTRPVPLKMATTRPAPVSRTDSTTWDDTTLRMLDEPQLHAFMRPDGDVIVFLWRAGRIYDDVQDEFCELDIPSDGHSWNVVASGNVASDVASDVAGDDVPSIKVDSDQSGLKLKDVRLSSDPFYVLLSP